MDSWGGSGDEGDGKCGERMKTGLRRAFQAEGTSARLVRLGTFCGHEQEARCGGGGGGGGGHHQLQEQTSTCRAKPSSWTAHRSVRDSGIRPSYFDQGVIE